MGWVRTAEAVADGAEGGDALLLEAGDDLVEGRARLVSAVVGEPLLDVPVALHIASVYGARVVKSPRTVGVNASGGAASPFR